MVEITVNNNITWANRSILFYKTNIKFTVDLVKQVINKSHNSCIPCNFTLNTECTFTICFLKALG